MIIAIKWRYPLESMEDIIRYSRVDTVTLSVAALLVPAVHGGQPVGDGAQDAGQLLQLVQLV